MVSIIMSQRSRTQRGGSSDFLHSFYASTAAGGAQAISKATLTALPNTPMFNPLKSGTSIPGASTGIVPNGAYLSQLPVQAGGGSKGVPIAQLRDACNANGLSCRDGRSGKYLQRAGLVKRMQKAGLFRSAKVPVQGGGLFQRAGATDVRATFPPWK